MTIKPVVVGVDGSEESLRAAEWAAMEAQRRSAALRVVSAPATVPRIHAYHASPAAVAAALRAVSERALDAALVRCAEVAPGLPVSASVLTGPVAPAVAASGSDASLLVVGARGVGGFAAMLLGSVSRYVAGHAPCPVVVAREETMAVHREIVVGIRDPQDATAALAFAFEEAATRGADLVAVHTWSWDPWTMYLPAEEETAEPIRDVPEQVSAEEARNLAAALEGWRDKYPDVLVRHDIVRGHPARVLSSYSARADLLVIGRHDDRDGAGPGIGTVQHAVLDHAHGPVAVIPSDG
jgi:nucleotide-binding universal stress UspA family protein